MPVRRAPDVDVLTAVIAGLQSVTTASYTEIPQGTTPPYVKITLVTGSRADTYGRFGKTITFDADCVTQGPSQYDGLTLRDGVVQALEDLNGSTGMDGHLGQGLRLEGDQYFAEMVNGLKTHHHVASFWTWTQQSSSS